MFENQDQFIIGLRYIKLQKKVKVRFRYAREKRRFNKMKRVGSYYRPISLLEFENM